MFQFQRLKRQFSCFGAIFCFGAIAVLALTACSTSPSQAPKPDTEQGAQLVPVTINATKITTGQTIYVPVYSYIYHYNSQNHVVNLSATLSIRNTDLTNTLILKAVRYYDTRGQLVREYISKPAALKPLAATDFFIETDDISGGLGASFIVEWVAEKAVSEPAIEAVMISTASAQGISFVSSGKVIKRYQKMP